MTHLANSFEQAIARFYSESELEKLQNVVVGILGAGGLGSNCAVNLVRSGVRHFILADYDVVDMSNLNRQYYFPCHVGQYKVEALKEILTTINPNASVTAYTNKISASNILSLYETADILIEAFDNVEAKSLFLDSTMILDKPKIMVSGLAGIGDSDALKTQRLGRDLYVIGDQCSDVSDANPYAPRVSIAAAKQADVVLSIVLDKGRD